MPDEIKQQSYEECAVVQDAGGGESNWFFNDYQCTSTRNRAYFHGFSYNLSMDDSFATLTQLLSGVILPNLHSVQLSQSEQIAANERLEQTIEDLRIHLESQFAHLSAQLTACRAELSATQASLKAYQIQSGTRPPDRTTLIH